MNEMSKLRRTVLVVDDEPDILNIFRELFDSIGYRVSLESSSVKALDLIKHEDFDLVITDLIMPERSGLEIVKAVKTGKKKPSVIIMAGVDINNFEIGIEEYGEIEFITKPFTIKDIKLKLEKLFKDEAINQLS